MKNVTFLVCFILTTGILSAQQVALQYIEKHAPLAIEEMNRTGIPASIKLAQGLLESDCGRSDLALFANNHFGIKCNNQWTGRTYYKMDDEKDKKGRLTESCFRVFDEDMGSYRAHSEFLLQNARYAFLFNYESNDYEAWAKGLKKAGYATDPHYPKKIIKVIEKYALHMYDMNVDQIIADQSKNKDTKTNIENEKKAEESAAPVSYASTDNEIIPKVIETKKSDSNLRVQNNRSSKKRRTISSIFDELVNSMNDETEKIVDKLDERLGGKSKKDKREFTEEQTTETLIANLEKHNGVPYHITDGNENLIQIAKLYRTDTRFLVFCNDRKFRATENLPSGERVYLKRKKDSYMGQKKEHLVTEGERIVDIAHEYGVKVSALEKWNNIDQKEALKTGQVIYLDKNNNSVSKNTQANGVQHDEEVQFIFNKDLGTNK